MNRGPRLSSRRLSSHFTIWSVNGKSPSKVKKKRIEVASQQLKRAWIQAPKLTSYRRATRWWGSRGHFWCQRERIAEGGVAGDWKGVRMLSRQPLLRAHRHPPPAPQTVGWGVLTSDPEQPPDPFGWQPDPCVKLRFKKRERRKWGEPGLPGQAGLGSRASITY